MNKWKKREKLYSISVMCLAVVILCFDGCGLSEDKRRNADADNVMEDVQQKDGISGFKGEKMQILPDEDVDTLLERLIADEGFRERVRYGIGIREEDSPETVLRKLEECEALTLRQAPYGNPIFSLESLELLPNLKRLTIDISVYRESVISDFTPIAQLTHLEELYFSYEKETDADLSFLAQMETLEGLFIINCPSVDISFLENMSQLKYLSLYKTPVEDLSILENLSQLEELSLAGNSEARHIETVGKLARLQDLGLQDCGIEDISFLSTLKELKALNLNGNRVKDLSPIAELTSLERLGVAENEICDITPLSGLTHLYDLALYDNSISDISALKGLSELNQVGISSNRIRDLSPLAGKDKLVYASVFDNPWESLKPVIDVPLLYFAVREVTEEEEKLAENLTGSLMPDLKEFEIVDFKKGDLNGDGLKDIAFVVDADFYLAKIGKDVYEPEEMPEDRALFVFLQCADGHYELVRNAPVLGGKTSGGMRGDPYHGMAIVDGYLIIRRGWGSSTGTTVTEFWNYEDGVLRENPTIYVSDSNFAEGYDIKVMYMEENHLQRKCLQRYVIAMDGYRMVKVDLSDSEHPEHEAFPEIELYDESYVIYHEKISTNLSPKEALEAFKNSEAPDARKEQIPYAAWQKEGYELLLGVELPDYYYVVSGEDGTENYFYYGKLMTKDGEVYHKIYQKPRKTQTLEVKSKMVEDRTGKVL